MVAVVLIKVCNYIVDEIEIFKIGDFLFDINDLILLLKYLYQELIITYKLKGRDIND